MIEAHGLVKNYINGAVQVKALDHVSLSVKKGEICSILGPSGCGKSTLLNCLSAIDHPDEGEIEINGKNIIKMNDKEVTKFRAKNMGFIFQFYNLIPVLNALENVELALLAQNSHLQNTYKIAKEALLKVGLDGRTSHYPHQLSGGERQRVAIARALVHHPKIIWADEPTGALDTKTGNKIMDLILELNKSESMTFVIVTHDDRIAAFSNRILKMDSGKFIQGETS
ncbi:MAG TPA: ABC transporter ATP-binding protein [Bacteroidales bacterium]|nr:ABC transporter ATP-binding protein [Bacteroidales bacterium]HRW33684.1 ABC transporter ATP-binding protein [Thermotogota bacterium]